MNERIYSQHDRDLLLASLLDVYYDTAVERVKSLTDEQVGAVSDGANHLLGGYLTELGKGDQADRQLMFQAVASMSDSTLHEVVQLIGNDPLEEN